MYVVRHDTPRRQLIPLLVKEPEGTLNYIGQFRASEQARPETQRRLRFFPDLGRGSSPLLTGAFAHVVTRSARDRVPQSEGHKVRTALLVQVRQFAARARLDKRHRSRVYEPRRVRVRSHLTPPNGSSLVA